MYLRFFGLNEKPFAITPDPRYLYLSERHAEALAHLLYGVNEAGGFIQLTGEVGTGKTTVVRTLLSRVPHHADVAVILNPRVTPVEFLLTICEELGLGIADADRESIKHVVDALNRRLLSAHAEGRRIIVIVDEAQNLSAEVLEQVRLLTNLETPTQKLLQIILIGQPELRELLDRTELRQLAQRITGRYHLEPLSREETLGYIRHRLRVAGAAEDIFTPAALAEVHRVAAGVPRVINVTCDRALLGAYTRETRKVTPSLVRLAAGEVYGRRFVPPWVGWLAGASGLVGIAGAALVGWQLWQKQISPLHASRDRAAHVVVPDSSATDAPLAAIAQPTGSPPSATPAASPAARPSTRLSSGSPAVPVATSINALLAANSVNTTDAEAFRRLLSLWGTAMADDKDPCGQAAKAGLSCLEQRGSWAQVKALNRPAILTLTDDRGQRHRVVLSALDDKFATLNLGEHNERVPLDELSRDWFGDFTVVWKPKMSTTRNSSLPCRTSSASIASMSTASPDYKRRSYSTPPWLSQVRPYCCPTRRAAAEVLMSFILDALKKSEIERQRQSVPGLIDTRPSLRRRRMPLWVAALCTLLAVNLMALTYVVLRKSAAPIVLTSRPADAPQARVAAPEARPFSPLDGAPQYAPEIPVTPPPDATPVAPPADGTLIEARPAHTAPAADSGADALPHPDPQLTDAEANAETDEVLPTISEISLSGTQALPELHLDVHVYATKPADRFVYINNRKYHEGAKLEEGPTVERIRRDGVVLNDQGIRFLLPRQP
jgi:general secretion pathway protein A